MSHKVQGWKVENPTIFKAGEQVEFMDSSGVVMRGTVCGEVSGNDNVGMAQVRLDFWEPGYGVSQSGCDSTHALAGREEQFSTRRLGRWACDKRLLVRVGAPSGHRLEERARPGEVCLTSEGTLDVSHEATKNAVQINRPVGGHHQVFVTENLPREEAWSVSRAAWPPDFGAPCAEAGRRGPPATGRATSGANPLPCADGGTRQSQCSLPSTGRTAGKLQPASAPTAAARLTAESPGDHVVRLAAGWIIPQRGVNFGVRPSRGSFASSDAKSTASGPPYPTAQQRGWRAVQDHSTLGPGLERLGNH
ncbi:hypothetical protein NDU88_007789 [Pleurodeles waltl]|uniref:Uncharacterized protein n=1 Tax=Pleurodeles waltl TaxID=8319 RepID=A0AAV7VUH5_PLEWA|nr:hypothetical protein NDU88_007789 [Pleurodeles waltl]